MARQRTGSLQNSTDYQATITVAQRGYTEKQSLDFYFASKENHQKLT